MRRAGGSVPGTNLFTDTRKEETKSPAPLTRKIVNAHGPLAQAPGKAVKPASMISREERKRIDAKAGSRSLPPPPVPSQSQSLDSILAQMEWESELRKSINSIRSRGATQNGIDQLHSELTLVGLEEKSNRTKGVPLKTMLKEALSEMEEASKMGPLSSELLANIKHYTEALLRKVDGHERPAAAVKDVTPNTTQVPTGLRRAVNRDPGANYTVAHPDRTQAKTAPRSRGRAALNSGLIPTVLSTPSKRKTDNYKLIAQDKDVPNAAKED